MKCETCIFFTKVVQRGMITTGNQCLRFPVSVQKHPNDWCGEHKPKEASHAD